MDFSLPNGLLNGSDTQAAWALYFSKWHTAMEQQLGFPFWGFSAQNEPAAHGHMWDDCGYTPAGYAGFVRQYLMPRMKANHPKLNFMVHDHNPDTVEFYTDAAYSAAGVRDYAWGTAVHWSACPATNRSALCFLSLSPLLTCLPRARVPPARCACVITNRYSDVQQRGVQLNATHAKYPDKPMYHTEGCVCRTLPYPADPGWWATGESYGIGLVQVRTLLLLLLLRSGKCEPAYAARRLAPTVTEV
eukprot:SAG22_NODE_1253_length_5001_cov_12.062220_3_plen_246_part_00